MSQQEITKEELAKLLDFPEACRALTEIGVDVMMLVDNLDFIFQRDLDDDHEVSLTFEQFMSLILDLRGANTATVKDIVELQKFVKKMTVGLRDEIKLQGRSPSKGSASPSFSGVSPTQAYVHAANSLLGAKSPSPPESNLRFAADDGDKPPGQLNIEPLADKPPGIPGRPPDRKERMRMPDIPGYDPKKSDPITLSAMRAELLKVIKESIEPTLKEIHRDVTQDLRKLLDGVKHLIRIDFDRLECRTRTLTETVIRRSAGDDALVPGIVQDEPLLQPPQALTPRSAQKRARGTPSRPDGSSMLQ
jgi:hypothetical protein